MAQSLFQNYLVRFTEGELVFTEGDAGATMFVVQSGQVRLYRELGGEQVTISTMEKGDFFGEMSLLEGIPRTCSAEATEDCDLIEINSTTFDRMIKGNIEIAVRMLRKLCGRLREAESRIGLMDRAEPQPPSAEAMHAAAHEAAEKPVTFSPAASTAKPLPIAPARVSEAAHDAVETPVTFSPAASSTEPVRHQPVPVSEAATSRAPRPATYPAPPEDRESPVVAAGGKLRQKAANNGSGPRLTSEAGDVIFALTGGEALIGRYDPVTSVQPEVDLTSLDMKRSVSRRHAKITVNGGVYELCEEAGVLNGTFVNGTRLVAGRPAALTDGDVVGMGSVRLVFRL